MDEFRMNLAGVVTESIVDGPGFRSTVFFQGCQHACKGCHNPETWDSHGGEEVSLPEVIRKLQLNPLISGVTFSGGEPFLQAKSAVKLGQWIKKQQLNLWIYTGFTWEYLTEQPDIPGSSELLTLADVIVDGPYIEKYRDSQLLFRGSSNQRLIAVHATLKNGTVTLWQPEAMVI